MGTNQKKLNRIVHTATKMTFLGGGWARFEDLEAALALTDGVICADRGWEHAQKWGVSPLAVVGDFDSVDRLEVEKSDVPVIADEDQNTTDFEKCLGLCPAPLVLGVGFLGGRLDHQLAALNAIARAAGRAVLLIGEEDLAFLVPDRFALEMGAGDRVSFFPLSRVEAVSSGLRWELDGLDLRGDGQIACSNEARGAVAVNVTTGSLIGMVSRAYLKPLVAALTGR